MIFHEGYARADAPHGVNHFGEELVEPTLIAFGTAEQEQQFLPTGGRYGLQTMCEGGGQANVTIIERL